MYMCSFQRIQVISSEDKVSSRCNISTIDRPTLWPFVPDARRKKEKGAAANIRCIFKVISSEDKIIKLAIYPTSSSFNLCLGVRTDAIAPNGRTKLEASCELLVDFKSRPTWRWRMRSRWSWRLLHLSFYNIFASAALVKQRPAFRHPVNYRLSLGRYYATMKGRFTCHNLWLLAVCGARTST